MSNFPLYDNMMKGIKNKDLTAKQKSDLIKKINNIDENGVKLLYALIKSFSINDGLKTPNLPYNGERCESSSISFDLEKFPNKLKQMLYKFSDIHDKSKHDE
jgi:hypothetical protein